MTKPDLPACPRLVPGAVLLACAGLAAPLAASPVEIVAVELVASGDRFTPTVTLRHADSGGDHYADGWRIVAADGRVLVHRTLYHPHVDEQPFTRSGPPFRLPTGSGELFVEARDNLDGWNAERLPIDTARARGPGYVIRR